MQLSLRHRRQRRSEIKYLKGGKAMRATSRYDSQVCYKTYLRALCTESIAKACTLIGVDTPPHATYVLVTV